MLSGASIVANRTEGSGARYPIELRIMKKKGEGFPGRADNKADAAVRFSAR